MNLLRGLGRNVVAGLRVALFLPVRRLDFRIDIPSLVLLIAIDVAFVFASDYIVTPPPVTIGYYGVANLGFVTLLIVIAALALGGAFRQPSFALAFLVISTAGSLAPDLLALCLQFFQRPRTTLNAWILYYGWWTALAWSILVTYRAVALALPKWRAQLIGRVLIGGTLLAAVTVVPLFYLPHPRTFDHDFRSELEARGDDGEALLSVLSEKALSAQAQILDLVLDDLDDERPGVADLYFVGFAPYAQQDVFRKEVDAVQSLFDDRFDTEGRSLSLVNNRRTLLERPLATVSNLRDTLSEIGRIIDPDDDIVFLYLTSHGSRNLLSVEFPPLELDQLDPRTLRAMLDDAGIKWRVVVVSACYSGSFIPALAGDTTLVITASDANNTSFGCQSENDFTYFGEAFADHALRHLDSFKAAFDASAAEVEKREKAEGLTPSHPQISMGSAIEEKLAAFERTLPERRGAGGNYAPFRSAALHRSLH
jgi:hypothetical protein